MGLGNLTRWSHPTWHLFHGMAEQISEEYFDKNRKEVLDIYSSICDNLPCPYCRKHAAMYLKRNRIEKIRTKKELKNYLYIFHNSVSKRTTGKVAGEEGLERYKMMNVEGALMMFLKHFFQPYYVHHNFTSWMRNELKEKLNKRFEKNWGKMFIGIRNPYKN